MVTISHHLAHAYSAFAVSPFEDGVVMIVDGVGSYRSDVMEAFPASDTATPLARESESYYKFSGTTLECLKKVWMEPDRGFLSDEFYTMPGLGALYSRASTYIFGDWNKCGELMGLAPYGRRDQVKHLLEMNDGKLHVPHWTAEFKQPYVFERQQLGEEPGDAALGGSGLAHAGRHRERAAGARPLAARNDRRQEPLHGRRRRAELRGERAGRARSRIRERLDSAGGRRRRHRDRLRLLRLARDPEAAPRLRDGSLLCRPALQRSGGRRRELQKFLVRIQVDAVKSDNVCRDTAKLLADQKVIGWFQDRSEFGPRALGNRSLIADPRKPEMKDILNSRVKHRQAFRPFAPIVLAERMKEVFEGDEDSPFMLIAKPVRPEWRDKIPAIVHVDGTARVQTVREATNPMLYRLLKEFEALTGVPVLINTSFNIKGEPIVETPQDAVNCFLTTGVDHLVIHDTIVSKSAMHKVVAPLVNVSADVRTLVASTAQPA